MYNFYKTPENNHENYIISCGHNVLIGTSLSILKNRFKKQKEKQQNFLNYKILVSQPALKPEQFPAKNEFSFLLSFIVPN